VNIRNQHSNKTQTLEETMKTNPGTPKPQKQQNELPVQREQFYQRLKTIYLLEQSGVDAQLAYEVSQTDQTYLPGRPRLL
jgi:hypothetical protein